MFVCGLVCGFVGCCGFFQFLCDLRFAHYYHTVTTTENNFLPRPKPELVAATFLQRLRLLSALVQNVLGPDSVASFAIVVAVTEAIQSISGTCSLSWLSLHCLANDGGSAAL